MGRAGASNMPHWISNNILDFPESNVRINSSIKWKDLQQDNNGRETVENW